MRRILALAVLSISGAAQATDHDNIDAGRPLSFDDADTIAYREIALEMGFAVEYINRKGFGARVPLELIYGVAPDTHIEIGVAPHSGNRAGSADRHLTAGEVDLGIMHSFRREIRNSPAIALKAEASIPTERGENTKFRLRGIISKTVRQYDRLHFNLDLDFVPNASGNENRTRLSAVLGYSRPLGYPTEFNTTGVAELAYRQGELRGQGATLSAGIGLRRQISPRSVFDIGIQSDLSPGRGTTGSPIRVVMGYSTSY